MNFYALIIGTEILNARREDKHFKFVRDELAKYNHELFATFIVKDDKQLLKNIYKLIKDDENSVMFSFGGIGSTPDDLTREISADIFTKKPLKTNEKFQKDIIERFGEKAYPHRVLMSEIPQGSSLLKNPINNMSGYSLEDRFFFVPGFPQMSHPMIKDVIDKYFHGAKEKFRYSFVAKTSEDSLINIMREIPQDIELSSLPMMNEHGISVEISLSGTDKQKVLKYMELFYNELNTKNIPFS